MERTFVLIKPDGVMRGLIGETVSRIERKGLNIASIKLIQMSKAQAENLYSMHRTKEFFHKLLSHITSAPVVVMVVEGPNAIAAARKLVGATNPQEATPGTIRADFALNTTQNVVHTADSQENAEREIKIFFDAKEVVSYNKPTETRYLFSPTSP